MKLNDVLNDLQTKLADLLKDSPAQDIKRNIEAILKQGFNKLDLVTREEFDVQKQVLAHAIVKIEELEHRIAQLEQQGSSNR